MTPPGRRHRPRIRRRLGLLAAAVTSAVVLAFCIPLAIFVRSVAYDRAVDSAELLARSLAAELVNVSSPAAVAGLVKRANGASETDALVYLRGGPVVGVTVKAPPLPPTVVSGRAAILPAPAGGRRVFEPVRGRGAATAVMVTVPAVLLTRGVGYDWALLFGGGTLLVLLAVVLADRLGRSIVRPIEALENVTRGLQAGDMGRRVQPAGPFEVAEVGTAVNELADRIDGLLEGARIAAADLGHRLRTPLTSLRLDVEALVEAPSKVALVRDVEALEAAVNRLIHETRDAPPAPGRCAPTQALRERMAFWTVLASAQGRRCDIDLPAVDGEVGLSKDDLEAAVDALLSNVFAHTAEGVGFLVALLPPRWPERCWTIVVDDEGNGLPSGEAGQSSPAVGTGLGLDMVRRTAQRGGGTVEVGRSQSGGFRVRVLLPDARPRPAKGSGTVADRDRG